MTHRYRTLFLTDRSPRHQEKARRAAPAALDLTIMTAERHELLAEIADVEILISERADRIDAELLMAAPKLRLIQRLGSLTHDIDVAAAAARGIAVCYWPIKGCILVAEHMVMQMLTLVKRLPEVKAVAEAAGDWGRPSLRTDENTFAYNWSKRTAIEGIYGSTVGILGFGEIGAELRGACALFSRQRCSITNVCGCRRRWKRHWASPIAGRIASWQRSISLLAAALYGSHRPCAQPQRFCSS
ncbi:MAG: hypothetical protein R2932_50435 [Caldilineaceae bacterium]